MNAHEYIKAYPRVPPHMVRFPGGACLDSGFVEADERLGWPQFDGGYIHWMLIDIREYKFKGWELYYNTPFRVYLCDLDDWNTEKMFVTEKEARKAVSLISTGKVTSEDLKWMGFAPT
jgi:hypothetical protein